MSVVIINKKLAQKKNRSIGEVLTEGKLKLQESRYNKSGQEAELLLSYLLNRERYDLFLNHLLPVSPRKICRYYQWIKQRNKGVPIQYITGFQNFMGLEFQIKEGVFIPRPETEILVEKMIYLIESIPGKDELFFLDIGVGSGVIPITICHHFKKSNKKVHFYAIDISNKALKLAKENAKIFHCENSINFYQKDIFLTLPGLDLPVVFDGIISNPPYIAWDEWHELTDEVSLHEPREALDGGKDGLRFYQEIIQKSPGYLKKENAFLALEIGHNQKEAVYQMITRNRYYKKEVIVFRDYYQNDRGIIAFTGT
jgi:release factor glutamine methyltransferase